MAQNLRQFLIEDVRLPVAVLVTRWDGYRYLNDEFEYSFDHASGCFKKTVNLPRKVEYVLKKICQGIPTKQKCCDSVRTMPQKVPLSHLLEAETIDYQKGESIILRTDFYVLAVENQRSCGKVVVRTHGLCNVLTVENLNDFDGGVVGVGGLSSQEKYVSFVNIELKKEDHSGASVYVCHNYYSNYSEEIKKNRRDYFAISDGLFERLRTFDNISS